MYLCLCHLKHMYTVCTQVPSETDRSIQPLQLELQGAVNHLMWIQLRLSEGTVRTLTHLVFPAPRIKNIVMNDLMLSCS